MIYIPHDQAIAIAPDLDNLPTTIRLPRDKRRILPLLILSGGWLIVAPFVVVFGPWDLQGWPLFILFSLLFAVTIFALIIGMAALRRNASQDEITLFKDHVAIRRFGWLRTTDRKLVLDEFADVVSTRQTICRDDCSTDYFVVMLKLTAEDAEPEEFPVFIHRNEPRAAQFAKRLKALVSAAGNKADLPRQSTDLHPDRHGSGNGSKRHRDQGNGTKNEK